MATGISEEEDKHGSFDDETMRMLSVNLPDKMFRTPDPRIQLAAMEAERTNQMTPVLKEELRLRILAKRMERGEPDLETAYTPKIYELTEEEKIKRERRKEQNRRAAKKCREKRKRKNLDVAEKYDDLQESNDRLKTEIAFRLKQKEKLEEWIQEHMLSGQCKAHASSQANPCCPGMETVGSCQNTSSHICLSAHPSPGLPVSPLTPISPSPPGANSVPSVSPMLSPSPELSCINNTNNSNTNANTNNNVFLIQVTPVENRHTQGGYCSNNNSNNHLHHHHHHNNSNNNTTTPPKPTLSRPVVSKTPSTTTTTCPFPPPQSPCAGSQSSSPTLTPPPSVSSEVYIVPESPSLFSPTSLSQHELMAASHAYHLQSVHGPTELNLNSPLMLSHLSHHGAGLSYHQLSPVASLSGKSSPGLDIIHDKMFDDDEDDDDDGNVNDISHLLDTLS